jgi:hypothetical protein
MYGRGVSPDNANSSRICVVTRLGTPFVRPPVFLPLAIYFGLLWIDRSIFRTLAPEDPKRRSVSYSGAAWTPLRETPTPRSRRECIDLSTRGHRPPRLARALSACFARVG